jgi:hypothetical protein
MTALELLDACARDRDAFQLHVSEFVDTFRRATPEGRSSPRPRLRARS